MKKNKNNSLVLIVLAAIFVVILVISLSSGGDSKISLVTTTSNTPLANATSIPANEFFLPGVEGTLTTNQQKGYERLAINSTIQPWIKLKMVLFVFR